MKKPGIEIEDQIKFIEDFVADPEMRDAIKENLIAIRYQQKIREASAVSTTAMIYPLTPNEVEYKPGTNSGHSFTEGHENR